MKAILNGEVIMDERLSFQLLSDIHNNPQNEDITGLIAVCLVRHGAVPEGYTAEDYRRDYMQGSYPFTDPTRGRAILEQCANKPLEEQPET